jgi:glycosyltransferase involved in cell wall biosynthesis
MRILLLCEGDAETWDSWSGLSRSVVDHLRADGHTVVCGDVDVKGASKYYTAARTFSPNRTRWWVRYHLGKVGFAARSRRAASILKKFESQVDVVLQVGATFKLPETSRTPYVLYCDSNIELAKAGSQSGFSEAASLSREELEQIREREATVYRGAARILTVSDRLRDTFIDGFSIEPSKVETIYAGPNFPIDETPTVPDRSLDREPVILFIGRAFSRKGGDLLVQAFSLVRQTVADARLVIVGPSTLSDEISGLPGVEVLGFVNKDSAEGRQAILGAYRRAKVFCLPTRFEPFGVVFLEAMHYELPCVGPRAWAVPEIIEDGVTGLLVEPENARALADALVRLLTSPEEASTFGKAGKARLQERFTWTRVVRRMAASMKQVLGDARSR